MADGLDIDAMVARFRERAAGRGMMAAASQRRLRGRFVAPPVKAGLIKKERKVTHGFTADGYGFTAVAAPG